MAICTQCGDIIHEYDMDAHICDPADVPPKGKMKKHGSNVVVDNPHKRTAQ